MENIREFFVQVYKPWVKAQMRPSTFDSYIHIWNRYLDAEIGWRRLEEYKTAEATRFLTEELRWILNRETILDTKTGTTIVRGTIRHPGICVIVAFLDEEHILLVHQYRYAAGKALWELPAGTMIGRLENGRVVAEETPVACAARELTEETGYEAKKLEKVCQCFAMPGTSDELMHIFFARQLTKREQSLDTGETIEEVRSFSLGEVSNLIESGDIQDAKTLVALFYALRSAEKRK